MDKNCSRTQPNSASKRLSLPGDQLKVPPAVCSVHPGRVLELSTSVGVSRYKSLINQEEKDIVSTTEYTGNLFTQKRGQLKSGRLRPLNLQWKPELNSQTCFGLISVKQRKSSSQHYRSLTAPITRPYSRHYSQFDASTRRIFSALSTTLELRHSICLESIGTNIKPLTQKSVLPSEQKSETITNSEPINVTISIKNGSNPMPPSVETEQYDGNDDDSKIRIDKNSKTKSLQLEISLVNNDVRANKKRRQRVSSLSEAKLSYGWSGTKPIEPIVGSLPPVTVTKRIRETNKIKENNINHEMNTEERGCINNEEKVNEPISDEKKVDTDVDKVLKENEQIQDNERDRVCVDINVQSIGNVSEPVTR